MHLSQKELFFRFVAQTNPSPLALTIERASGVYLYDSEGNQYLDLISGISVCNIGHQHPAVVSAIHEQVDTYMHVMVYGETVQSPQVNYAKFLTSLLPESLNTVYFVNSGSEAIDLSMKLAKRVTSKNAFVAQINAYHGSGQGPLSLMSDSYYTLKYRPLLNNVYFIPQNDSSKLEDLPENNIAAVVVEMIQGERGAIPADFEFIQQLFQYTKRVGALFIIDEIQTGFYRTGNDFAFKEYGIIPDVLVLGKALGGGMPLGAVIASNELLSTLADNPILGHITTFGGHPVSCTAGLAANRWLHENISQLQVLEKEVFVRSKLIHPLISKIHGKGLLLAIHLDVKISGMEFIYKLLTKNLFTDWFLFETNAIRFCPPLTISYQDLEKACSIITMALDENL